jgi:hypothetical protein
MYFDLIKFPLEHEKLRWQAQEALLDVHGRPHLFVRLKLTGTVFPVLAQVARVWIGETLAKHVTIDEDRQAVRAYFEEPLPEGGGIYFGHLARAELRFGDFDVRRIERLDRARLPRDVVVARPQVT